MICSRPMNTLSTKYSKSCSRVSGVSMVASELVDKLEHLVVVQTDLVEQLLTRCGHRECLKQRHRQGFVRYIIGAIGHLVLFLSRILVGVVGETGVLSWSASTARSDRMCW